MLSFVFLMGIFGLFGLMSCEPNESFKNSVKKYSTDAFSNDLIYGEIIQLRNHDSHDGYIAGGVFGFSGNISENQYFTGSYKNTKGEILVFKIPAKRVKLIDSDQYVLATSNFYNYIDAYIDNNCGSFFEGGCKSKEEIRDELMDIINNATNTINDNYMTKPYSCGDPRLLHCGLPIVEIRIPINLINNFVKIEYSNDASSANNTRNSRSNFGTRQALNTSRRISMRNMGLNGY
jgi:hypothetical protein